MSALERFHATMKHNEELRKSFNKYAASKGVALFEDAARVEHEQGYLRILYRTLDARFAYFAEVPDGCNDLEGHYMAALTAGIPQPEYFVTSTGMLTEDDRRRWQRAVDRVKDIKPPLDRSL